MSSRSLRSKTVGDLFADSDVFLYFGEMFPDAFVECLYCLREFLKSHSRKPKVTVLISTPGGSADEAFRIMRLFQEKYKEVHVVIIGACYSAGTLFALGADKIFMSDGATLGPLDVQIRKEDDVARMSGECYRRALYDIGSSAQMIFAQNFSKLKLHRRLPLSTSTASKIATEIAVGLLSPITARIEPIKLGEMMRSQMIGASYGKRLMSRCYRSEEIELILTNLTSGYPSHGTVIDFEESKKLGLKVEKFDITRDFDGIFLGLERQMICEDYPQKPIMHFLNDMKVDAVIGKDEKQ